MKKLYCINAEYNIKCKKKELFNKNKDTLISRYIEDKYLVCDEKDIKQNTLDLIKKNNNRYEQEIQEFGKTDIFHFSPVIFECGDITINKIIDYEITHLDYREATIEECIQHLTPDEYKKIYGNHLNIFDIL